MAFGQRVFDQFQLGSLLQGKDGDWFYLLGFL